MGPAKLKVFISAILIIFSVKAKSKDFVIFSVMQDVPMGIENEIVKKNFYLNMGVDQGLRVGTVVNVFRNLSQQDPYNTKKRFTYSIKIAELEIIHSEDHISIANLKQITNGERNFPLVDVQGVMIGDRIEVKVN
jgi:hypothetical protein